MQVRRDPQRQVVRPADEAERSDEVTAPDLVLDQEAWGHANAEAAGRHLDEQIEMLEGFPCLQPKV